MDNTEKIYAFVLLVAFVALMFGIWNEFFSPDNFGIWNIEPSFAGSGDSGETVMFSPENSNSLRIPIFILLFILILALIIWILKLIGFGKKPKKKRKQKSK